MSLYTEALERARSGLAGRGLPVRKLLLVLLLLLACGLIDHRGEGLRLYQQGHYAEAEVQLRKVKD